MYTVFWDGIVLKFNPVAVMNAPADAERGVKDAMVGTCAHVSVAISNERKKIVQRSRL